MHEIDNKFMMLAIIEAKKAILKEEVPVGAILVDNDGNVISRGYNRVEKQFDISAHAEMIAIRKASRKLKSWRLNGFTLYTTLEPCIMCLGAIMNSRISKIVFGTRDHKEYCTNLVNFNLIPTTLEISKINSNLELQCSEIITNFFKKLRLNKSI